MLQQAKLINAKALDKMYFVEYTIQKGEEPKKHLLSLVALGNNGRCAPPASLPQPSRCRINGKRLEACQSHAPCSDVQGCHAGLTVPVA